MQGVKRPKLQRVPMKNWSSDQAKAFLEFTRDDRLSFAWWLLLARGLRRGELCGLRWEDVDLEGSVLWIYRTRVSAEGGVIDSTPRRNPDAAPSRSIRPLSQSFESTRAGKRPKRCAPKLVCTDRSVTSWPTSSDSRIIPMTCRTSLSLK